MGQLWSVRGNFRPSPILLIKYFLIQNTITPDREAYFKYTWGKLIELKKKRVFLWPRVLIRNPTGAIMTSVKNRWIVINFIYILQAHLCLLHVFYIFILFFPWKDPAIMCWRHTRIAIKRKDACSDILTSVKNV